MALFSGDDPSILLNSREDMERNYLLSPWPWDRENTDFTLNDSLTDIVLNIAPGDFHPEGTEILFLERLNRLWPGRVSSSLQISESQLDDDETADIIKAIEENLLPLYDSGIFDEVIWDLNVSPEREELVNFSKIIAVLRAKDRSVPYIYALSREEKPLPPLWESADGFIIKAYDFSGRHSTYENAEESVVNFIRRKGKSPAELILSIPLYGRKYRSSDPEYWVKQLPYREIVEDYYPGRDVNEEDNYYFNGPDMAERKTRLARDKELKGVALYPYEWDSRGPYSLKEALSVLPD